MGHQSWAAVHCTHSPGGSSVPCSTTSPWTCFPRKIISVLISLAGNEGPEKPRQPSCTSVETLSAHAMSRSLNQILGSLWVFVGEGTPRAPGASLHLLTRDPLSRKYLCEGRSPRVSSLSCSCGAAETVPQTRMTSVRMGQKGGVWRASVPCCEVSWV